jgi:hypothetical protein
MDNEPWQTRLKRVGMNQKDFAKLLGVAERTVSMQLRGKWESGTPQYVKAMILVLERLPIADRAAIMDEIDGGV